MNKSKNLRKRDWRDTFKKFLKEALNDGLDKNTPDDTFRVNVVNNYQRVLGQIEADEKRKGKRGNG